MISLGFFLRFVFVNRVPGPRNGTTNDNFTVPFVQVARQMPYHPHWWRQQWHNPSDFTLTVLCVTFLHISIFSQNQAAI